MLFNIKIGYRKTQQYYFRNNAMGLIRARERSAKASSLAGLYNQMENLLHLPPNGQLHRHQFVWMNISITISASS